MALRENIKKNKSNHLELHQLQNCVHAARIVTTLLRHPSNPFDTVRAKHAQVKTNLAKFALAWDTYICDGAGCHKELWSDDFYVPEDRGPKCDFAWCATCARGRAVKKFEGSSIPVLHIKSSEPEAKAAAEATRQSNKDKDGTGDYSLFVLTTIRLDTNHVEVLAEVLDGPKSLRLVDKVGPCKMTTCHVSRIVKVLAALRLQRANGMMTGLICLRYKKPSKTKFHMINFLVSPDREVFFIDACAKKPEDRSGYLVLCFVSFSFSSWFTLIYMCCSILRNLTLHSDFQANYYCKDVFFLPAPHTEKELQSIRLTVKTEPPAASPSNDGACNAVLSYLREHKSNATIVQAGLTAVRKLSCDEEATNDFIATGVSALIINCMELHKTNTDVIADGLWSITHLTVNNTNYFKLYLKPRMSGGRGTTPVGDIRYYLKPRWSEGDDSGRGLEREGDQRLRFVYL